MENPDAILGHLMANDAWVRALARRLVTDPHLAEDVVQDAWLAAMTHPPKKGSAVRSWLGRVVRNFVRLGRQADANRRAREKAVARPEPGPSVAELRERERTRHEVTMAVFGLEEPYRSAILLRYFENRPPREIAALQDISVAAVESRLRRGLEKLRARLDRDFGERRSWCAALLPLAGRGMAEGANAAGPAAASLLTGALVMSLKIKIGIAVLVALGVAYAVWPRPEVKTPSAPEIAVGSTGAPVAERDEAAEPPQVDKAEATSAVAETKQLPAPKAISLEPARGSIVGVVTDHHGAPIPAATVKAFRYAPGAIDLERLVSTRTDASGRYRLGPIPDWCILEASSSRHYRERRRVTPFSRHDFQLGRPGGLKGRVFRAADGSPCPGATVAVYTPMPGDSILYPRYATYNIRNAPVASRLTDAAGGFRMLDLKPGRYHVHVLPAAGPQLHSPLHDVEIAAGQETTTDLAVGSGFDLGGRVLDRESRQPIAGATVCSPLNQCKQAVTDGEGRFVLRGLAMDRPAFLQARAPGYVQSEVSIQASTPASFQVEVTHEVVMSRGMIFRGRVVGPDGRPVSGARVGATDRILRIVDERFSLRPADCAMTDEDGKFEVTASVAPPFKERRVFASREGLAWGCSRNYPAVPGAEEDGVVVRLRRGWRLSGRILDENGKAIESAQVVLHEPRRDPFSGKTHYFSRSSTLSRAGGAYEIADIPEGTYRLEVIAPGVREDRATPYATALRDDIVVSEGDASRADVVLKVGATITGRVEDERGRPLDGVGIQAKLHWRAQGNRDTKLRMTRWALTESGGRFRIEGLEPVGQRYALRLGKAGFDTVSVTVDAGRSGLVVTLPELKKIHGRVVHAATGKPVPEFKIQGTRVSDPAGGGMVPSRSRYSRPHGVFADLEGRFTMPAVPGVYDLQAQAPDGLCSGSRTVEVPTIGTAESVELAVSPGGLLRGRMQSSDGKPVTRLASLGVWTLDPRPPRCVRRASPDKHGCFEIRSLPAGTLLLYGEGVMAATPMAAARRIDLPARTEQEVQLTLRPCTRVELRVVDEDRKPIEGARVKTDRADGASVTFSCTWRQIDLSIASALRKAGKPPFDKEMAPLRKHARRTLTVTDVDGRLAPLLLLSGDYVIEAGAAGYEPCRTRVRIHPSGRQTVEIVLKKP